MSVTQVVQYGISMPSRLKALRTRLDLPLTPKQLTACREELLWLHQQCEREWIIHLLYGQEVDRLLHRVQIRLHPA